MVNVECGRSTPQHAHSTFNIQHSTFPVAGRGGRAPVMTALLAVHDIEVAYGAITALHGISIDVEQGEIVTLIGANGAGKTTTLRTISGLLKPRRGGISFKGGDI